MARIDLRENEFMEKFVGQEHIDSNDNQFWYKLLSCSFNFMRVQDPKIVDKTLDPYLVRLTLNNNESLNIGSLVRVALDRVSRIKSHGGQSTNPYYLYQSFNAIYLIRSICKSYIENVSEEKLVHSFRAKIDTSDPMPQVAPLQVPPSFIPNQPSSLETVTSPPVDSQTTTNLQSQVPSDPTTGSVGPTQQQTTSPPAGEPSATLLPPQTSHQISQAQQTMPPPTPVQPAIQTTVQQTSTGKKSDITSGPVMFDQFLTALIEIIVDIPQTDATYLLQVEAINALLVLLSIQMYTSTPASKLHIYKSLMQKKCSIHALILTKTLLANFVRQQPVPQETGSIIIGLASGLWNILTLGYATQEEEEADNMPLLARQSLLLLNILSNHHTTEKNPYREAIVSCQDSKFSLADPQQAMNNANNDALATAMTSKSALMSNSIKIEFSELYETICKHLSNDQVALLLYILLHSNKIFRPYILTTKSSDLGSLVMPLLKILYTSIEKGSHHVYMVVIIFIILSEEASFNEAIHKAIIRGVPWYKDRILSEISLGSLTTLIVIRSFQFNTFRIKDKFLHSNLYATLANLSNHFHQLHPYVCQRIIELLERLTKRYFLLTKPEQTKPLLPPTHPTLKVLTSPDNPLARALATDTHKQDLHDVSSIELDSTVPPSYTYPQTSSSGEEIKQNGNAININIPPQQVASSNGGGGSVGNGSTIPAQANPASQQSPSSNSSHTTDHINISMDDGRQDIGQLEEVIRMILSVINNSLAMQLEHNSDLIYTLLYKRHVFSSLLMGQQSFYNMVINIERILTYFYEKIESYQRSLSVEEIMDLIRVSSREWNHRPQDLNANSRLLFHYVEDEQPEEFFIPYIWTRIYYSSGIFWNPKQIVLFNQEDL